MSERGKPRKRFKTQWTGRTDSRIAQVAEVIGVSTDMIMAVVVPEHGHIIALYTPEGFDLDNPQIYAQHILRNHIGMLTLDGEPELQPGMWQDIKRDMDEHMKGRFGDTDS